MKISIKIGGGLLVLGMAIFYLGFKVANYHLYFLMVGGIMAAMGLFLLRFLFNKEEKQASNEFDEWRNGLKSNGVIIEVNFDQCELKSNQYREAAEEDYLETNKYMALDALVGKDNTEYNDVDQSVIVFETMVSGEKRTFYSPLINKERTTLQFLLADKKDTKIYVDSIDRNNYYFDLEFIWKK